MAARAGRAWRWTLYRARSNVSASPAPPTGTAAGGCPSPARLHLPAAFRVAVGLGLVVTGLALFAMGWRVSE